jgi:hypothetical protein
MVAAVIAVLLTDGLLWIVVTTVATAAAVFLVTRILG